MGYGSCHMGHAHGSLFAVFCSYLFHNPRIQWQHLQIYMVLFTGPLPISDTLKFPYMMHCCSDNKQVISWVRGQLPAAFDSLFLNLAQETPYNVRAPVPRARGRLDLCAPRCWITASATWNKHRLPPRPHRSLFCVCVWGGGRCFSV